MIEIIEEFKELHIERTEIANFQLFFVETGHYEHALTASNRIKKKNKSMDGLLKKAIEEKQNEK